MSCKQLLVLFFLSRSPTFFLQSKHPLGRSLMLLHSHRIQFYMELCEAHWQRTSNLKSPLLFGKFPVTQTKFLNNTSVYHAKHGDPIMPVIPRLAGWGRKTLSLRPAWVTQQFLDQLGSIVKLCLNNEQTKTTPSRIHKQETSLLLLIPYRLNAFYSTLTFLGPWSLLKNSNKDHITSLSTINKGEWSTM